MSDAQRDIDEMIAMVRSDPDGTWVTWRFNQGAWETTTGREFLELLAQPVAGGFRVGAVWQGEGGPRER